MLEVRRIHAGYGAAPVLRDLSLDARAGEILCLLGRNGAGKTTAMKAIMGLLRLSAGEIRFDGRRISGSPAHETPLRGIGYVPQGRRLFGELSVAENLEIGLMARGSPPSARAAALALFPRLQERLGQRADTLSGGEQTMLAVARALCLEPRLLLLDEPTEGLQPSMTALIRDVMLRLRDAGVGIVLVEQRIEAVLAVADRVAFIENGHVFDTMTGAQIRATPEVLRARLGI